MLLAAHPLVHVNASLNTIATVLLVMAYLLIKRGKERSHRQVMRAAIGVSAAFLACYLYYHYQVGSVRFTHSGVVKYVYLTILASHIVLAMTVPFLVVWSAYLGTQAMNRPADADPADEIAFRRRHRSVVRWAYPIWLYVSVTGVIVYLMLYHFFPPAVS